MGFEYQDEMLELKYNGKVYQFREPSALEHKAMAEKFKDADDKTDVTKLYIDFFVALGLPEDVVSKMSMKGIMGLFEYAVGSKKN